METTPLKKILVATDFTELAENAVKTASFICQRQNATLILLHVIEDVVLYSQPEIDHLTLNYLPQLKDSTKKKLKQIGNSLRKKYHIKVSEIATSGDIPAETCRIAQDRNADLIIIGTHGTSGFRRFFIGSTTYKVIKYSKIPVMTVPGEGDWISFTKILFPIRLVPKALEKYSYIRPIIQRNNSTLYILGLATDGPIDNMYNIFGLGDQLEERLRQDQVKFEVFFDQCNDYAERILAKAEKTRADLIVITATLDVNLTNFFIGPFTQQIINHAKVPVLCIRPN